MTILNEYSEIGVGGSILIACGFLSAAMILVFFSYNFFMDRLTKAAIIRIAIVLLISAAFILLGIFNMPKEQYVEATISDTITFEEITDNYEFIKQEGKIYTFKVKNNEQ